MSIRRRNDSTVTVRRLSYLTLLGAVAITLGMVRALQPTTLQADLLFSGWLLSPYVLLTIVVAIGSCNRASALAKLTVVLLASGAGLALLADIIFFHPDPQGPIALLMVPLVQGVGILVALPLAHWSLGHITQHRNHRHED